MTIKVDRFEYEPTCFPPQSLCKEIAGQARNDPSFFDEGKINRDDKVYSFIQILQQIRREHVVLNAVDGLGFLTFDFN